MIEAFVLWNYKRNVSKAVCGLYRRAHYGCSGDATFPLQFTTFVSFVLYFALNSLGKETYESFSSFIIIGVGKRHQNNIGYI